MNNRDVEKKFEVEEIKESSYAEDKLLKKEDEYLKYKYVIIFLTSIIVVLILIVVYILFNMKGFRFSWRIFYNKDGDFQWLAITAIAAMFTFLFTTVITVRKNKADLVAKSRIEWIQEVKKIMSVFLKDVHYYPYLYVEFQTAEPKEKIQLKKESTELLRKIEENQYLLLLHLSDNTDNKQINDCIVNCTEWVNNMPEIWRSYNTIPVTNLLKVSRDYFKKEWNKSKKGK